MTAVLVLLVARIWENVWDSGCLEVKCGNCVSRFHKKVGSNKRWRSGVGERVCCLMVWWHYYAKVASATQVEHVRRLENS